MVSTKQKNGESSCPGLTLLSDIEIEQIKIPKGCMMEFFLSEGESGLKSIVCNHNEIVEFEEIKFKKHVIFYSDLFVENGILASPFETHGIKFPTNSFISFIGDGITDVRIGAPLWGHIDKDSKEKIVYNGKQFDSIHCYITNKTSGERKWSPHETTKAEHQQDLEYEEKRE